MTRNGRVYVLVLALAWTFVFVGTSSVQAQNAQNSGAGVWDPNNGSPVTTPISMFLVPNGSGTPFTNCFAFGGIPISVIVRVRLADAAGPVAGVTAFRIRLEEAAPSPTVAWCSTGFYPPPVHAPNLADGPTDVIGETKFSMAYHGGGWAVEPTHVWLEDLSGVWVPLSNTPLRISYNSPDIDGNLVVNLTDVTIFAVDYLSAYDYRSDFNFDGVINLTDLAMFAPNMGVSCP